MADYVFASECPHCKHWRNGCKAKPLVFPNIGYNYECARYQQAGHPESTDVSWFRDVEHALADLRSRVRDLQLAYDDLVCQHREWHEQRGDNP